MDDEEQIETREAAYASQLADEAVRSIEQLFDDCPEDQQPRFAEKIREWLDGQESQ